MGSEGCGAHLLACLLAAMQRGQLQRARHWDRPHSNKLALKSKAWTICIREVHSLVAHI